MLKSNNLNNPFFTYPGSPFKGYPPSKQKLNELLRLYNDINKLSNSNEKILFHLTIGAPMEEIGYETLKIKGVLFQINQILPSHLLIAAKKGINVLSFIVAPNEIKEPLFLKFRKDFKKITSTTYEHKVWKLRIEIYHTLMPTENIELNMKYLKHFKKINLSENYINLYQQTSNDVDFINKFYCKLSNMVKIIMSNGGYCSCYSFAVFNELMIESVKYKNFAMFKEVLKCFNNTSQSIIREWVFRYGIYHVSSPHFGKSKYENIITYITCNQFSKNLNATSNLFFAIPQIESDNITMKFIPMIQLNKIKDNKNILY